MCTDCEFNSTMLVNSTMLQSIRGLSTTFDPDLDNITTTEPTISLLLSQPELTIPLLCVYAIIFIIGMFGNIMVLYVVLRHRAMQSITNKFIACLSTSDILLCLFAIPFTPINALMPSWIFGETMCKLVPVAMCVSVFVSTWTCVAIALDRYFAIVHPHVPRMSKKFQALVIAVIWTFSVATSLPIAIFTSQETDSDGSKSCRENWPNAESVMAYTCNILVLQVVLPVIVISYCYVSVSVQLYRQAEVKIGSGAEARAKMNAKRNKRINKMLIAMVVIFVSCWLPLDLYHFFVVALPEDYALSIFLITHVIAMSSVMYNPILYGWMNDNFNNHFRKALPCINKLLHVNRSQSYTHSKVTIETTYKSSRRPSPDISSNQSIPMCNGSVNASHLACRDSANQVTNELVPFLTDEYCDSIYNATNGGSVGPLPSNENEKTHHQIPVQLHMVQQEQ